MSNTTNTNWTCPVQIEPREFTWYVNRLLVLVSMLKKPHIVGSSSLQNFQYWKDLDSMETLNIGTYNTRSEAIDTFQTLLMSVIRRVLISKEIFFNELKAGYAPVFHTIYKLTGENPQKLSKFKRN